MKPYILKNKKPIPAKSLEQWSLFMRNANRVVAKTDIGKVTVSTVFLGLDHNFLDDLPILFETMIFGGKYDGQIKRYSTWAEAKQGHYQVVEQVKGEEEQCINGY